MKSINNNLIVKLLIASLIVFLVTINVSARVFANGAGQGYGENENNGVSKESTIEDYLIAAGGYYLNSCRYINKFLYLYEIHNGNGIDYNEWEQVIDNALANMSNAVETYDRLIKKAEVTPYNETVTAWLMAFDYTGYMNDNGLNSVVFQCLAEFLIKGDITGLFKFIYSGLTDITEMLGSIKGDVSMNKLPEISIVHELNESCSTLSLLGSYISRVFYENQKVFYENQKKISK